MAKRRRPVTKTAFALYDLELVVERIDGQCTCRMRVGDRVFLRSGKVSLPAGADFCLYALQAAIPLLPAKQRQSEPADWMSTDDEVACPDPNCSCRLRIVRTGTRSFRRRETTAVPLAGKRQS